LWHVFLCYFSEDELFLFSASIEMIMYGVLSFMMLMG